MSTETIRIISDGETGEGVMEVEKEDYILIATLSPALVSAAMRAILIFH